MTDIKNELTVVVQGKCYHECTYQIVLNYLQNPRISSVIYSGWDNTIFSLAHKKLVIVYNEDPKKPGDVNRNRQIVSSYNGLKYVKTKYAWKVRSDQIYGQDAINCYLDFFEKNFDENNPKIFTPGLYNKELFHIRDHQTMSSTSKVKEFWNCPLDEYDGPADYNICSRAEAYFVCNYLRWYDNTVSEVLSNKDRFLYDSAPERAEMLKYSNAIMPKYFVPFPKVSFSWPKHGMAEYHYDVCMRLHGEYWS
jgi:hypothetical protein